MIMNYLKQGLHLAKSIWLAAAALSSHHLPFDLMDGSKNDSSIDFNPQMTFFTHKRPTTSTKTSKAVRVGESCTSVGNKVGEVK